jgi:hypothetical protein
MKLENQQSTITNPQFSGGRMIGSGSAGGNTSFASASLDLAGIVNTTGSFSLTSTFGHTTIYTLTASNQTVANQSAVQSGLGSHYYVSISGSATAALKTTAISSFLNVSSSTAVTNTAGTVLYATSSINGTAGNSVYFSSGSTTVNFAGGSGTSDYPYTFPFVAGGLYIGQAGTLVATTIDGSNLTFVSASGFIPGIFQAVSSASTSTLMIALK